MEPKRNEDSQEYEEHKIQTVPDEKKHQQPMSYVDADGDSIMQWE